MLILHDAHLRIHIVLERVVVAVEVVGRDVHQHTHVGTEVVHAIELERAQLQHIPVKLLGCHLIGKALADVAAKGNVEARIAHNLVDQRRCGGLAIRACDADGACLAHIFCGKLHLRDNGGALLAQALYNLCLLGYAGRLDDKIGLKDALHRVTPLLPLNLPLIENGGVALGHTASVREKYPMTLLLGQHRRAVAADAAS